MTYFFHSVDDSELPLIDHEFDAFTDESALVMHDAYGASHHTFTEETIYE